MKDNDMITRREVEIALLEKGQKSKRYKLGEIWELNFDEIREALSEYQPEIVRCRDRKHEKTCCYAQMKVKNGGTTYVNTQYITAYGYAKARNETVVAVLGEKDPIYFPGDQTEEIRKSINYERD